VQLEDPPPGDLVVGAQPILASLLLPQDLRRLVSVRARRHLVLLLAIELTDDALPVDVNAADEAVSVVHRLLKILRCQTSPDQDRSRPRLAGIVRAAVGQRHRPAEHPGTGPASTEIDRIGELLARRTLAQGRVEPREHALEAIGREPHIDGCARESGHRHLDVAAGEHVVFGQLPGVVYDACLRA